MRGLLRGARLAGLAGAMLLVGTAGAQADVLVTSYSNNTVPIYTDTGAPNGTLASPPAKPTDAQYFGPLLVSSESGKDIFQYDPTTLAPEGVFSKTGLGLYSPEALQVALDHQSIYAAGVQLGVTNNPSNIFQYAGNGTLLGKLLPTDQNSLFGFAIAPNGNFYFGSENTGVVQSYNPNTNTFATVATLSSPSGMSFGPDGMLYVADLGANDVVRINTTTNIATTFVTPTFGGSPASPTNVRFGLNGNAFITDAANNVVYEYDLAGAPVLVPGHATPGVFVDPAANGLSGPTSLTFTPEPGGLTLMGVGMAALGALALRRRSRKQ